MAAIVIGVAVVFLVLWLVARSRRKRRPPILGDGAESYAVFGNDAMSGGEEPAPTDPMEGDGEGSGGDDAERSDKK